MKRVLSVLLAVCIIFSLSIGVFAATINVSANKPKINAGDEVTVTLTAADAMDKYFNFEYCLYYDAALFDLKVEKNEDDEYVSVGETNKYVTVSDKFTDSKGSYYKVSALNNGKNFSIAAEALIADLIFIAKSNIASTADAKFELVITESYRLDDETNTTVSAGDTAGPAVTVTVTPASQTTGYSVAASTTTASTTVDSNATVSLNVTNAATSNKYNAYYFEVTYDNTVLQYVSCDATEDVTVSGGTLKIAGYGKDRTNPVVLTFKGLKTGSSAVTINKANIDEASKADTQDAPEAKITTAAVTITVAAAEYTVDLSEDFTGASTVTPGADYTFTAKDKHYDYTIDAKMNGSSTDVIDNGDGSFTIRNVSGNLTITATKTPKSYTVTVNGTGKDDVNAANTATYLTDYTFTLTKDDKYTYEVTATVDGKAYTPTLNADGKTYSIAGADVTGNIVITVNKTLKPVTTTAITFTGSGSADVKGGTTQTADNGKDFTFELNAEDGYDYTVTLDGETLAPDASGKYTIPGAKITGTALTVTVEKTAKQTAEVNVYEYVKLNGKAIYLVTASGTVADGKVMAYDGSAMFWSEKYKAYAYLVISDTEVTKAEAAKKVSQTSASKTEITYDGDVNATKTIDVNDAQLVYNMYNAKYTSFDNCSMEKFLRADVNGSKDLTVADAAAIVNIILTK